MNHATRTIGDSSLVNSRAVTSRPEKLLDVVGYNAGAACFVQIHESAAAPADGAVPKFSFPVGAQLGFVFGQKVDLAAIYVCFSTTPDTKTLAPDGQGSIIAIVKG